MNSTCYEHIDLTGYLSCGRFYVNDQTVELGRAEDADGRKGMVIRVTDSTGNVLSSEMCYDGEPGMTGDQIASVMEALEQIRTAMPVWTDEEEKRKAAECLREIAEKGTDGSGEGENNRAGLYALMLELYHRLYPAVDDDLEEIRAAKAEAVSAASAAQEAAQTAAAIALGDLAALLFYYDGDSMLFIPDAGSTDAVRVTSDRLSPALNASGYVSSGGKQIRIKFHAAKLLNYISDITCECFDASIANSGGYALTPGAVSGGTSYLPAKGSNVESMRFIIDKVQNCIHCIITGKRAFSLNNNEPVTCRCHDIRFTLHGEPRPEGGTGESA